MIESVLGNECKLVNPWQDKKIVVESINPGKAKVDYKIINNNLVTFSTKKNTVYMVYPEGSSQYKKQKEFVGERNTKPKYFQEAILGKPRDF